MRVGWRGSSDLEDRWALEEQEDHLQAVSLHAWGQTTVLQQGVLDDRRPAEGTAWEPDFVASNQHLWAAVVGIQEDRMWITLRAGGETGTVVPISGQQTKYRWFLSRDGV